MDYIIVLSSSRIEWLILWINYNYHNCQRQSGTNWKKSYPSTVCKGNSSQLHIYNAHRMFLFGMCWSNYQTHTFKSARQWRKPSERMRWRGVGVNKKCNIIITTVVFCTHSGTGCVFVQKKKSQYTYLISTKRQFIESTEKYVYCMCKIKVKCSRRRKYIHIS